MDLTKVYLTLVSPELAKDIHEMEGVNEGLEIYIFLILFILRKTEAAQVGEGQRERERERIPSKFCTLSTEPDAGLEPTKPRDHDLS